MTGLLIAGLACAKKKEGADQAGGAKSSDSVTTTATLSGPLTTGNAPFASVITGKGYQVVQARRFPAQVDARRATVVVYRAPGGDRGGVLYVRGFQEDAPQPVWHWYFSDAAPDSVAAMDVNRDGLWDMRAYMAGGVTRDFLQDKDFTFRGAEHPGSLVAMNGASSSPDDMWKMFDADTSTAWRAPADGAYFEIPNPFGIETGQLSVRLAGGSRPSKLEIGDGSRKLQECDLDATVEEQRFQLDPAVRELPTLRIQVVGKGNSVAVSELELR